jgi:hypothetical protein
VKRGARRGDGARIVALLFLDGLIDVVDFLPEILLEMLRLVLRDAVAHVLPPTSH